jgi:hypothetical protein
LIYSQCLQYALTSRCAVRARILAWFRKNLQALATS